MVQYFPPVAHMFHCAKIILNLFKESNHFFFNSINFYCFIKMLGLKEINKSKQILKAIMSNALIKNDFQGILFGKPVLFLKSPYLLPYNLFRFLYNPNNFFYLAFKFIVR